MKIFKIITNEIKLNKKIQKLELKRDNQSMINQLLIARENNNDLRAENELLNDDLKLATNRKIEYRDKLESIRNLLNCNTLGNPENIIRKIKSMLTKSGKHC